MQRRPAPCRHGALAAAVPRGGLETLVCGRYVWASVRFSLWLYVSLGLQLGDLALETRDLELLRLHLAVARKRMFRIVGELDKLERNLGRQREARKSPDRVAAKGRRTSKDG